MCLVLLLVACLRCGFCVSAELIDAHTYSTGLGWTSWGDCMNWATQWCSIPTTIRDVVEEEKKFRRHASPAEGNIKQPTQLHLIEQASKQSYKHARKRKTSLNTAARQEMRGAESQRSTTVGRMLPRAGQRQVCMLTRLPSSGFGTATATATV